MPTCDFIFDDSYNVCPDCHHFRDIRSKNVHDLVKTLTLAIRMG